MRALIFLLILIIIFLFLRWLFRQPRRVWLQFAATGLGSAIVVLAATGRLHWLAAIFGVLLPFVRKFVNFFGYIPLIRHIADQFKTAQAGTNSTAGQNSTVESRYFRMSLDHDTGEMFGEVLEGQFKGRRLDSLTLEELSDLYAECQAQDKESAALLQAYLNRVHGEDWSEQFNTHQEKSGHTATGNSGKMSSAEAYAILGLTPPTNRQEVIEAHRRLVQKLHPDRGGSTYLAAKINQAKKVLLDEEPV